MITTEQVVNEIRRLAAEQPDFVYVNPVDPENTDCLYVHNWGNEDGLPVVGGCIAGQALMNLGVPASTLHDVEFTSVSGILPRVGVKVDIVSDRNLLTWMDDVQSKQDIKNPWGLAVKAADQNMEHYL
jgi:hypothetical protein